MMCMMGLFGKGLKRCIGWQEKKGGRDRWDGNIDGHVGMAGGGSGGKKELESDVGRPLGSKGRE
jgi:hypothetical protein